MKSLFGRYTWLSLGGIIVQTVVIVAVLIQALTLNNNPGPEPSGNVFAGILTFLSDWAEIISALAVCSVLVALFTNLHQYRRQRYLKRFHGWAKSGVMALADYRRRDISLDKTRQERFDEMKLLVKNIREGYPELLTKANTISGEFDENARKVARQLAAIAAKAEKMEESAFEDLTIIRHNLAVVMIIAFKILKQERLNSLKPPATTQKPIRIRQQPTDSET